MTNLPSGISATSFNRTSATTVTFALDGNRTIDYDNNITNLTVECTADEVDDHVGSSLTINTGVVFTADDDAESISISYAGGQITEGTEDGEVITVTLTGGTFVSSLTPGNWSLSNLPTGVSIGNVSSISSTTAEITLSGDRTSDYDSDKISELTVDASEVDDISTNLTSTNTVTFDANDDAETVTMSDDGTIDEDAEHGEVITVSISGGTFAETLTPSNWVLTNLPTGVSLGNVNRVNSTTVELTLSGNRTVDYETNITNATLTIDEDELDDYSSGDYVISTGVTFIAVNDAESISLAWAASPGTNGLEATMDDEALTVTLTGGTFISGAINTGNITASGDATSSGVSIESVAYVDATHITVNLAWNGTDYDVDKNLIITVGGAAYNTGLSNLLQIMVLPATEEAVTVSLSDNGINEGSESIGEIYVSITQDDFVASLDPANWTVNNLPTGVSKGTITRTGDQTATISLSGNRTVDYDSDITNVEVVIAGAEFATQIDPASANTGVTLVADADGESLALSSGTINEGSEDGSVITVTLTGGTYANPINPSNWTVTNLPSGISATSFNRTSATTVTFALDGNRTIDYDNNITNLTVECTADEVDDHVGSSLTINTGVVFTADDDAESISISYAGGQISEGTEDGEVITVTLTGGTFVSSLTPGNWSLSNLPTGVSIGNVSRISSTTAEITLSGDRTSDYDSDKISELTVDASEVDDISTNLTSTNTVTFDANDDAETVTMSDDGTIDEDAEHGEVITVSISGGTFAETLTPSNWVLTNLPTGVSLGNVNRVNSTTVELTLSGNRTVDYETNITDATLTIDQDELDDYSSGDYVISTGVTFIAVNDAESISLAWAASPGTNGLEATMDDEALTVTLTGGTFISGAINTGNITASGDATSSGVSIESVAYVDATHITVNLAWNGTDYDVDKTLTITIDPAAYNNGVSSIDDDIVLTATQEVELNVSATSLNYFGNVEVGTTSSEQSFTVSGSNLNGDISIVPPAGFEISLTSGGSFSATNPILLTPSSGTVASTSIYVRFAPSIRGSYSDNISVSTMGYSDQDVSVGGFGTCTGAVGTIVFTEIADYYSDANMDYLEIFNSGNACVDLDGVTIEQRYTAGTASYSITLSSSNQRNSGGTDYMLLEPGEFAVIVFQNFSDLISNHAINANVAVFSSSTLPIIDGDDRFMLSSPSKAVEDYFGDWDGSTFSSSADKSYERISASSDGEESDSWTISSSTSYGPTPGAPNANPLPVEMVHFSAIEITQGVYLNWSTASEEYTHYFSIQQSTNATDFAEVGQVPAAGFSNTLLNYEFTTELVPDALNYFRLICYDFDGRYTISKTRVIKHQSKMDFGQPRVVDQQLILPVSGDANGNVQINVLDANGRILHQEQCYRVNSQQELRISLNQQLTSGIYYLQIRMNQESYSARFIVNR